MLQLTFCPQRQGSCRRVPDGAVGKSVNDSNCHAERGPRGRGIIRGIAQMFKGSVSVPVTMPYQADASSAGSQLPAGSSSQGCIKNDSGLRSRRLRRPDRYSTQSLPQGSSAIIYVEETRSALPDRRGRTEIEFLKSSVSTGSVRGERGRTPDDVTRISLIFRCLRLGIAASSGTAATEGSETG